MKALTKIGIGFLSLAAVALGFTSCSSEDVASGTNQGKMSSLTLTINTGKSMGSRATDWTADPAGKENNINRITVGIFSSDGEKLRTIVELESGTGTDNTFKPETNGASTKIVTNSLEDRDLIKVAVNAPKGHFVGIKKASDFQAKSEDASVALLTKADDSKETTKEACNNNVPMYGEGTLTPKTPGDNSVFTVSGDGNKVTVKHMLAKVSLESLGVDFKPGSAYANAEFTPVAAFLINVPDKMNFTTDVWKSDAALLHGWSAYAASDHTNCTFDYAAAAGNTDGTGTYAQYLTTENLTSATALSGTATTNDVKAWFYTLPNEKVDNGAAVTKNTKLVIAGKFIENTSATSPKTEMVYYSLPINATYDASSHKYVKPAKGAGSAFQVCPNQYYKCSVTIRTKGSSTPNTNLTPQEAEIKVEVTDFVEVTQNAEFN